MTPGTPPESAGVIGTCCECGIVLRHGENVELGSGTYCELCAEGRDEQPIVSDGGKPDTLLVSDGGRVHFGLMDDGELYDLIVEAVGDESSMEFVAMTEWLIDDNDLGVVARANLVSESDLLDIRDRMEELAE